MQGQGAGLFDVLEQGAFLLQRLGLPALDGLGALHHLGRHVADMTPVPSVPADLAGLDAVRPGGGAGHRLGQTADFAL